MPLMYQTQHIHFFPLCSSSVSSHVGITKLTSDVILIPEILNGRRKKETVVCTAVQREHLPLVPSTWLTIEAENTTLS